MDFPHELTVKRLVATNGVPGRGTTGGWKPSYTTAARGSLPTKVNARAIQMSYREKLENGIRGELQGWKFLIDPGTDPQMTQQDRVFFTYVPGQTHEVKVTVGSHARCDADMNIHHYTAMGHQDTTET